MRVVKRGLCFALLVMSLSFFAVAARADLYWENEVVSSGMPNQAAGTKLQKNYFISTASRIETGDGKVVILDYNSLMMYNLNPQNKTYTQVNMSEMGMPPKMAGPEKEQMGKAMAGMMSGFQITPTDETKTIAGYKCRKYNANFGMVQGEYWASKDVTGYQELRTVSTKLGALLEKNPMLRQMNVAGLVEKLDGFPVQVTNHVMGGTIVSTLKKVEQKPLDPELFKVPSDYTLRQQQ
jgi:hypothetical protein